MPSFTGQLRANEIFATDFNMIISQEVNAKNIADGYGSLVERARVDGGLLGDTKLYYETDALQSYPWTGDNEAANLLNIHRPADPACQAIVIDIFRQIPVTVDSYLTKRMWVNEGSFAQFNGVMLGWLSVTKKVYDETTYNVFLGTNVTSIGQQSLVASIDATNSPSDTADEESAARIRGQKLAEYLANLFFKLRRPSRDYNDLAFLRSYAASDLTIIWNAKYVNEVKNIDLPTVFHDEKVSRDLFKDENILPEEYFGGVNSSATAGDGSTVRSLVEQVIGTHHYFAGDLIEVGDTAPAGTSYTQSGKIICKVVAELPVFMSGFVVGTSFFNARSLTENHYLTWSHNSLEHFVGKPFITIEEA